ncbi:MAG: dephospho-CoA kinase [Clostridiales bacterium]|nr:dephospho-CoA kinase [Clostridiales bacterium]
MMECKVIGIPGGIGTGKTFLLQHVKERYQMPVIVADEVGHLALQPGTSTYQRVVEAFGKKILREDGSIDRGILGSLVFFDSEKRTLLNGLVHPFIEAYNKEQIAAILKEGSARFIFLEAAILLESNLVTLCDEIWVICADIELRSARLIEKRGYQKDKIDAIIQTQLSEEEMKKRADHILWNNGNLEDLDRQIEFLLV